MVHSNALGLFYFSGTGNTKIVAHLLAEEFRKRGTTTEIMKIEDYLQGTQCNAEDFTLIGIGYPIHALNAPKIVFDFINQLPPTQNKKTFTFKCSADIFMKGGATTMVRTALSRKGYEVVYERLFLMPSNVLVGYDDELVKQLYNAAVKKTREMCDDIISGKEMLQKNSILSRVVTRVFSSMEWSGTSFIGRDFRVSESCTLCNICVENCPVSNISRQHDKITFGGKCISCMRCVYNCPEKAIMPRLFRFFVLKDGYNIQDIIHDPEIKGNYVSEDTTGYFKRFYDYLR